MAESDPKFKPKLAPIIDPDDFGQKQRGSLVVNKRLTRNVGTRDIGEGEFAISIVGGVKKLNVKINGEIVSTLLT